MTKRNKRRNNRGPKSWGKNKEKSNNGMEALSETSKASISWKPSFSWIPLLFWGTLELFSFWKHWPFNKSKQTLPITIKEAETIEDKMEAQKRKFETMLAEKDARIDDSDKKLKITEEQKDNDIKQLMMENQNLDSKQKQTEKILRDTKKELDDAEANTKQRDDQIKHLQMEKGKLDSTLKQTERDKTILNNELFEVRNLKREAEAEKHDALRRLSEMVSVKLRDNNPNIVDLNDEYRPTKLAEMFSELYDNEWTAAYTVMEDNEFQDRQMIDFLLDVVMESYIFCKDEVEKSWNVVSTWFLDDDLPKVQQMRKALKDGRKAKAWKLIPDIEKKYTSYIESVCRHEPLKKLLSIEDIRKYMALCLKLTLLMNANDPPVYLECSGWKPIRDREEEDKDLQKSENSGDELPNNGEQPNSQDDKDEEKETAETTETDSSSQDITPDDMDQDEGQKIEKQPEGKSNENPSSTESKERLEKKDGTESNENVETGSCQQGDAPTGNDDSGQDSINKDKENKDNAQDIATEKDLSQIKESNDELSPSTNAGVNEDAGEEMVVNNGHGNAESSSLNKLVEDPMDQGNSQNAGFSDERRINEIDHECKNNENPSSTESKERFEKKDETECNKNLETGSCQQGDAPTGNDDSGQDSINKDKENKDNAQDIATEKDLSQIKESNDELSPSTNAGVNEDAGEEMVVNNGHGNAESSSLNKLVEDPMDQGNSQNAGFSDERRINEIDHECKNNENPSSTESKERFEKKDETDCDENLETGSCQQGDAPTGNDDSSQDSINKDKENKDNAQDNATEKDLSQIKESNDELSPSTNAGVNEDAGEEMVVNNGHGNAEPSSLNKLVEDPMDQGNSPNTGFSDERRNNEIDHECKNNENPNSAETTKPSENKERTDSNANKQPENGERGETVADAVEVNGDSDPASSPTNDENGTTRLEEEKDKLKTNSPSSGCENDNDDSSKICGRELRNEVTVAATRGEFEKDKYKEYTTRGKYTEFHVWPIMYLHKGGPMLGKGIAQGVKDSKAEPSDKPWAWWK
ncbi:myb-like protein X isoform X2 [Mya arenaria]|uniref:myb-like protein X isoform X2 n=2 Tax=Mya arenaria TaxID=6604 RepID=UPI0022E5E4D2|nr:myb-like protein X isoform X2 [Mya arenaria]